MIKLYKAVENGIAYHEAWLGDDCIVEHWGSVGERGESREHPLDPEKPELENLRRVLTPALEAGFVEVPMEEHRTLVITYPVEGMGSAADVEKQGKLRARMDETLGWTGLGRCDGGSIGSG